MEDGFDKLFYLLISIIYAIFSYSRKHTRKEPPEEVMPEAHLPPATAAPTWEDRRKEEFVTAMPTWEKAAEEVSAASAQYAPVTTPSASVHPKPSTPSQQPPIERVLGRYSSRKKAMVMSELMRPYSEQ